MQEHGFYNQIWTEYLISLFNFIVWLDLVIGELKFSNILFNNVLGKADSLNHSLCLEHLSQNVCVFV